MGAVYPTKALILSLSASRWIVPPLNQEIEEPLSTQLSGTYLQKNLDGQKIAPKTTSASAFARFRYNTITKDLITKVPGEGHGILNFTFQMLVLTRFMEMGISVGDFTCMASPMARLGPWLRQPDSCWAPPGLHEPLSVVLELGVTGAESGLLADVHQWLETPGSPPW